ncbi:hypothetical protein [Saccharopolyspora sp. ASAGF58]|uniref:hypothetical protein n=1 Tax=Saccharopolyspora sp. ASAGF58 TaxID=2719023 RepID=UPI0014400B36|nr:hypothetical protein [Saccharopolyspora sp. ASAGF58]QIZ33683.1 hypothetical protein FDZ84_01730 [Saccharopolyspora sp. ASAGF58]
MSVITWDGHLRIDHLPDRGTVAITLLTAEPTLEVQLRNGLVAGFVAADPEGPPTFVSVALRDNGVPDDVAELLGPRVAAAVADAIAAGGPGGWLELDLGEVDGLAEAWAPYRAVALEPAIPAPRGTLGAWAGELWTRLDLAGWAGALRGPELRFRSGESGEREADPPAAQEIWRLPDELAAAVGVAPEVTWTIRPLAGGAVEIGLAVRPAGGTANAVLQAGLDDGSQHWETFEPDPSGVLRARLVASGDPVGVRFRSESRRSA